MDNMIEYKFKVGDTVRYVGPSRNGLTHGALYECIELGSCDAPIHLDDDGDRRDRSGEQYELVHRNVAEAKAGGDEWGPEIKVEGKRPDIDLMPDEWQWGDGKDFCRAGFPAGDYAWDDFTHIKLKANHPHYKTLAPDMPQNAPETHRQGTNEVRTSQECLERMEALVRRMAAKLPITTTVQEQDQQIKRDYAEANAIAALLPEPVDPDLVEARRIANQHSVLEIDYTEGKYDHHTPVQSALSGLKRGRALERGEG